MGLETTVDIPRQLLSLWWNSRESNEFTRGDTVTLGRRIATGRSLGEKRGIRREAKQGRGRHP